jgi:hypothetical protein
LKSKARPLQWVGFFFAPIAQSDTSTATATQCLSPLDFVEISLSAQPLLAYFSKTKGVLMLDQNFGTVGPPNEVGFTQVPQADTDLAIDQLNSFLRGEISAAETYRMAIDRAGSSDSNAANVGLLRGVQEDHGRAAQAVRDRIRELGGEATDSSGAWGAWAKFTQGTANLFGDVSSLKALKEGEEHGLKDYERGVVDIDATSAELVQNQLIPAQQRHINLLDQLIQAAGSA